LIRKKEGPYSEQNPRGNRKNAEERIKTTLKELLEALMKEAREILRSRLFNVEGESARKRGV